MNDNNPHPSDTSNGTSNGTSNEASINEAHLVEQHLYIVKSWIKRIAARGLSRHTRLEELYADGCLGLWRAVQLYRRARGAALSTYAYTRVRGAILDGVRSRRGRRYTGPKYVPLETKTHNRGMTRADPTGRRGMDELEAKDAFEGICRQVNDEVRALLHLMRDGLPPKAAAKQIGRSHVWAYKRLEELRERFQAAR